MCPQTLYVHNTKKKTQEIKIYALSWIRTYDPNNQEAADLPHRPQVNPRQFQDSWLLQFKEMSCRLPRPLESESVIAVSFLLKAWTVGKMKSLPEAEIESLSLKLCPELRNSLYHHGSHNWDIRNPRTWFVRCKIMVRAARCFAHHNCRLHLAFRSSPDEIFLVTSQ